MSASSENNKDPKIKYWWIIAIVVPVVVAMITIIPLLTNRGDGQKTDEMPAVIILQNSEKMIQATDEGSIFNNVKGDIIITTDRIINEKN